RRALPGIEPNEIPKFNVWNQAAPKNSTEVVTHPVFSDQWPVPNAYRGQSPSANASTQSRSVIDDGTPEQRGIKAEPSRRAIEATQTQKANVISELGTGQPIRSFGTDKSSPATAAIAELRRRYDAKENQALELAQQIQKNPGGAGDAKETLRRTVAEA